MCIRDRDPTLPLVTAQSTLHDALDAMLMGSTGSALVVDRRGRLVGLVTIATIMDAISASQSAARKDSESPEGANTAQFTASTSEPAAAGSHAAAPGEAPVGHGRAPAGEGEATAEGSDADPSVSATPSPGHGDPAHGGPAGPEQGAAPEVRGGRA